MRNGVPKDEIGPSVMAVLDGDLRPWRGEGAKKRGAEKGLILGGQKSEIKIRQ